MRPPKSLKSRKFLALMWASTSTKFIIMATMIGGIRHESVDPWLASIVIAMVFMGGLLDMGYILSQASLDKVLATVGKATDAVAAVAKAKGPKP